MRDFGLMLAALALWRLALAFRRAPLDDVDAVAAGRARTAEEARARVAG